MQLADQLILLFKNAHVAHHKFRLIVNPTVNMNDLYIESTTMCSEKCSKSLIVDHTLAVNIGHLNLFDD